MRSTLVAGTESRQLANEPAEYPHAAPTRIDGSSFVSLSVQYPAHLTIALLVFLIASLTDYLDGVIARRWNLITDFGKLMDPLADKILTASAFICLIPYKALPAWVVIIIISREFLITGLRLLASSKGVILPAEKLGKHKTAWQMITIVFFLALLSLRHFPDRRLTDG